MELIVKSDKPETDSIVYILYSMVDCEFIAERNSFLIIREHNGILVNRPLAFSAINQIKPGLADTILDICRNSEPEDMVKEIKATVAHLCGCFVDVKRAGIERAVYPYLTQIKGLQTKYSSNAVEVNGLFYEVDAINTWGIPKMIVADGPILDIPMNVMENIWSGSSKAIPIMESLAYTTEQMVQELTELARGHTLELNAAGLPSNISM